LTTQLTMKPVSSVQWRPRTDLPEAAEISQLATQLGVHPLTARTLMMRGHVAVDQAHEFLTAKLSSLPDPDLLPGMAAACARLEQALLQGERIAVHGDYDVDGISGCALLVETLRQLGAVVEYHIPLRLEDGYGLSGEALRRASDNGCSLVLSVDCGVTALAEAELAQQLALDLIITDHHQPPPELPACLALINPHLPDSRFPWQELSGVGVAFFLLIGLRRWLREQGYFSTRPEPDLRTGLDLVALGTIADMVPLGGVNRVLVRAGLPLIEAGQRTGLAALKRVAAVTRVTSGTVGYHLAPRLNAAGRLEDAALGVELLLGADKQELEPLAGLLDGFNRERREIEQSTLAAAIAEIESAWSDDCYSLVLAGEGWHPGVIGIVASRLIERYHRPTVLIAFDGEQGKGSARSISNFHLYQALAECATHLQGFGGHAMAAGISLQREQLDAFRAAFEQVARQRLAPEELLPTRLHDGELNLADLDLDLLRELDCLAPCGIGNPQPVFISRGCRVHAPQVVAGKHLKFTVEQNGCRTDCIAFGQAERLTELDNPVDLLYRPEINQWRGHESVQLVISDFQQQRGQAESAGKSRHGVKGESPYMAKASDQS
jgi:single-stranded-DNA-specific exonuclease